VKSEWEEHAGLRWVVVKLGPGERRVELALTSLDRQTTAETTVVELEGVETLLVVGTTVGDPTAPFDPDDEVWEPHGWVLTLGASD
jgi:hypothetical protein